MQNRLLACALLLTAIHPAQAQRPRPGAFDFYVFAMSIAPSFCDLTGNATHKRQCDNPSNAAYQATPLTIHGLWPNLRRASARDQPANCSTERLPRLSEPLARDLQTYMPGVADGLPSYEWGKHGVCSGLTPEAYFQREVDLAKAANATIGEVLKQEHMLGRQVQVDALAAAVAAKNPDLARALIVDCQFSRSSAPGAPSRAYIAEVRVLIAKDLPAAADGAWPARFVPLSTVGYRANSGCPRGEGFLPGGFRE